MEAIPTLYQGTLFRSRLEAQWATLFDKIGLSWVYEPEGFTDGKTRYLPDFWLPDCHGRGKPGGLYFEVKPNDHRTEEESAKAWMLAKGSGRPVIIVMANPPPFAYFEEYTVVPAGEFPEHQAYDHYHELALCDSCGAADIGFYSSDEPECSCGRGRFHTSHKKLIAALSEFPIYARWTPNGR